MRPTSIIDTPELLTGVFALPAGPWRVRACYAGPNSTNQSGESSKFWQITGLGRNADVEVRWGRIGAKGQAQTSPLAKARDTLSTKIRKGYVLDDDTTQRRQAKQYSERYPEQAKWYAEIAAKMKSQSTRPAPLSLAESLQRVAWRAVAAFDDLLTAAAAHAWVAVDLNDAGVPGDVRLYVGRGGTMWAARVNDAGAAYAQVHVAVG